MAGPVVLLGPRRLRRRYPPGLCSSRPGTMNPSAESTPHRTYTERRAAAETRLAALDRVNARYANLRGLTFLGGAAVAGLLLFGRLPKLYWWAVGGAVVLYATLAVLHHYVFRREARERWYV